MLSRRFGLQHVQWCEDAAQTALLQATLSWPRNGVPLDRGAWLYRVAHNHLLDEMRRARRTAQQQDQLAREPAPLPASLDSEPLLETEVRDDQLRLLFVCADPTLPGESQLVFALKVLCGFSTEEIALRTFASEDSVHKRLQRARNTLRTQALNLETPDHEALMQRAPAVRHMLYLLFNEGYSSAQPDQLLRRELCEEGVRLALLLLEHRAGNTPETYALLSLMYLHAARFEARVDGSGGLLLLEDQDRSLWDQELIGIGMHYLKLAGQGGHFSRYHAEAAIAAEHCLATSFSATRWPQIVRLYEALERVSPSPLNTLNRAIALAEWQGPAVGLQLLQQLRPPGWVLGYYLWDATLGELFRRVGDFERARAHLSRAEQAAPTIAERALIGRRLSALDSVPPEHS